MANAHPLESWLRCLVESSHCPAGAVASARFTTRRTVELHPLVSSGRCLGLIIAAPSPALTRQPLDWLRDNEVGKILRWLPLQNGISPATVTEEIEAIFGAVIWKTAFPTAKALIAGRRLEKAHSLILDQFRHRAFRGLPNIHFEPDPESPSLEIMRQLTIGERPLFIYQRAFESIYYDLLRWIFAADSVDSLQMFVKRPDSGYVQFSKLENSSLIYAESMSRLYKEKRRMEVSPDHENTARLLGWRNDDLLPNDYGLFEIHTRIQVAGLAMMTLFTLILLHRFEEGERLKITLMDTDEGWSQDTIMPV